jgi:hypothetical protein
MAVPRRRYQADQGKDVARIGAPMAQCRRATRERSTIFDELLRGLVGGNDRLQEVYPNGLAAPGFGRSIHVKRFREIIEALDRRLLAVARRQHEHGHREALAPNK